MRTYVVPVPLTLFESGALEFEVADPAAGFLGILRERKLPFVAVPGAEKVDSLAIGGGAESEVELDRGHCAFPRVGLGLVGLSSMTEDPKILKSTLWGDKGRKISGGAILSKKS